MLVGPEKLKLQIISLFSVTVGNKLSYGLGKFVGIHVFILIHPTLSFKKINFHDSASKR